MSWLGLIGSIGSALIGGSGQRSANDANLEIAREQMAFNREEAEKARTFNSAEAARQRDWQGQQFGVAQDFAERMSSTAYQRAVGDLNAAGLNPMLAYSQGSASAPNVSPGGGSSASGPAASTGVTSARQQSSAIAGLNAAATALQLQNIARQGENIDADTALKNAQANREAASAGNLAASTEKLREEIPKVKAEIDEIKARTGTELWKQTLASVQEGLMKVETALKGQQISQVEAETELARIRTVLSKLAEPEARNAANAQDSWWMRNISPYLPDVLKSTGAAGGIRGLAR